MASSYKHCIDDRGRLLSNANLNDMLENGGDVFEAVEELYGMIWFLALGDAVLVERARSSYEDGIAMSPGRQSDDD